MGLWVGVEGGLIPHFRQPWRICWGILTSVSSIFWISEQSFSFHPGTWSVHWLSQSSRVKGRGRQNREESLTSLLCSYQLLEICRENEKYQSITEPLSYLLYFTRGRDKPNYVFKCKPTDKHSLSNFKEVFFLWKIVLIFCGSLMNLLGILTNYSTFVFLLKSRKCRKDEAQCWNNDEHTRDYGHNLTLVINDHFREQSKNKRKKIIVFFQEK